MFTVCRPFPGVTHITDIMGVSFTLVEGEDAALLLDAGYGLEDAAAFVGTLTEKPVELILSHGHHDHVLGARWFTRSRMDPADLEEFHLRTALPQRLSVRRQAAAKGLPVPDDFLTAPIPDPLPLQYTGAFGSFASAVFTLGGRDVWAVRVPGHTAGSLVLYIPDTRLLLTADDWNPCTWMWFPCSLPVRQWRENMMELLPLLEKESGGAIAHVLCSHQAAPRQASELKAFLACMTDERLRDAPAADLGSPIRTHRVSVPEKGWELVFDADKLQNP